MRILLLGELSGLHKELRLGLIDEGHEVITGHVGPAVATYPIDAQDETALIDAADRALYHAKRTGKNRIVSVDSLAPLTPESA